MIHREPSRPTTRRIPRILVIGLVAAIAAIPTGLGYQLLVSSSSTAASVNAALRPVTVPGGPARDHGSTTTTEQDGVLPAGVTVFDEEHPGVADLDVDLLEALRAAARDAAGDGVEFSVNSGWRSPQYQEQLLREAVSEYGSEVEAARWVAPPDRSAHVSGDAVDLGSDAATWLADHGSGYGLCPIYGNEPWHYELRPEAIGRRCPDMYPDPTADPRMRQQ